MKFVSVANQNGCGREGVQFDDVLAHDPSQRPYILSSKSGSRQEWRRFQVEDSVLIPMVDKMASTFERSIFQKRGHCAFLGFLHDCCCTHHLFRSVRFTSLWKLSPNSNSSTRKDYYHDLCRLMVFLTQPNAIALGSTSVHQHLIDLSCKPR